MPPTPTPPLPMEGAHGLVVGIARYRHITPLPETVLADARDVHTVLTAPTLGAYPPGNVALLLDEAATRPAILEALAKLATVADDHATVFVFVSSHGGRIVSGPRAGEYLLPVDADYASDESLAATAISGMELTAALRAIKARKLLVIFDCCHSGGIGEPKALGAPGFATIPDSYYATLAEGLGRVILASSRSDEYSYVLPGMPNSLFTHHLLAALRGAAPGPGGVIRIFDLFGYLQPKVTGDHPAQHPIFKAEVEDNFPVALHLGGKAPEPASPVVAREADALPYDVFLSYRGQEPDRSWVRKVLRPALEAAGLRAFIDHRDFRLGEPVVLEMARAVEQSRYTLAVLTPAYEESSFTEIENVMAEHLGLETKERRLLAVMREPTPPRLGLRTRLWLDMTDDDEFEVSLQRLIHELSLPSSRPGRERATETVR
ncbi:MAG TPA: TIR domain-containing protein [Candidatus Limnocylindrales bacterium]|nr:TIR domain-containing protein [Candidatus Limnocylindrales bacterium]